MGINLVTDRAYVAYEVEENDIFIEFLLANSICFQVVGYRKNVYIITDTYNINRTHWVTPKRVFILDLKSEAIVKSYDNVNDFYNDRNIFFISC